MRKPISIIVAFMGSFVIYIGLGQGLGLSGILPPPAIQGWIGGLIPTLAGVAGTTMVLWASKH